MKIKYPMRSHEGKIKKPCILLKKTEYVFIFEITQLLQQHATVILHRHTLVIQTHIEKEIKSYHLLAVSDNEMK